VNRLLCLLALLAVPLAGSSVARTAPADLLATSIGNPPANASSRAAQGTITGTPSILLPHLLRNAGTNVPYPNPRIVERLWQAAQSYLAAYPPAELLPAYGADAGGPSAEGARRNVEAACHDFPDLPANFGAGAHHRACYEWVAANLATFHAVRARREGSAEDVAWAGHYLDAAMDVLAEFVYGPEEAPKGGYRDTLAAVWQNPARAADVAILADLVRQAGALGPEREARSAELLSAAARAWHAEFWLTGVMPTTGITFTTASSADVSATSLAGHPVVAQVHHSIVWNADKGNTPAEEMAWMGAGVMLAAHVLGDRLPDGPQLYSAGQHYVDFALTYDRPDPVFGGRVRTLNAETEGGPYGQRRYWLENHTADVPSIPYVGYTWHQIGLALYASELGGQRPWPSLVPDDGQWQILLASANETLRAPDGSFLIDLTPGRGIGYSVDALPEWHMPCGQWRPGRHYVRYDGRAGGAPMFVSEIGYPAGLDVITAGWPILRIAADRQDQATYDRWVGWLNRVLDDYIARPPNPGWSACGIAPYLSTNVAYHWSRMLATLMMAYLGASGYMVEVWSE
jgi:hypothetical protein